jgi:hypothetical protein
MDAQLSFCTRATILPCGDGRTCELIQFGETIYSVNKRTASMVTGFFLKKGIGCSFSVDKGYRFLVSSR